MKKWNYEKRKHEEYTVPQNWRVGLYSRDLEELIDCACCGTPLKISQKYRSLEIHNEQGQEYAVCKRCFKEEWVRSQMSEHRVKVIKDEER